MIITLPWPDKRLSPNARVHWATKAKAVKAARWVAFGRMLGSTQFHGVRGLQVSYTFHPSDARRRDLDNLIASTKASTDGIAQACSVDDSTFKLSYAMGEIRKPACVVVTVETARGVLCEGDAG